MKTTLTELRATIAAILACKPIYGARQTDADVIQKLSYLDPVGYRDDFCLNFEQAWGVGCNLRITFRPNTTADRHGQNITRIKTTCDLGWSSTNRSLAEATASVALYRQVIELGALIEAATDGLELVIEEKAT